MKYKITHTTTYEYADVVPVCQNLTHLIPRSGERQHCSYQRFMVKPSPTTFNRRVDYFGNPEQEFSIHEGHRVLRITAISKVQVLAVNLPSLDASPGWETIRNDVAAYRTSEDLAAYQFCFSSPQVAKISEMADYARGSFLPGRPALEAAMELNRRIYEDFTYDQGATDVSTPVREVFSNRRGVCQDLAHVAIGCLRSIGLPARYVSGYLRTIPPEGAARLVGADASHAWFSMYCGEMGWIDFDPTNDLLPSEEHVTLAWGRDYGDVAPVRGVFVGGGRHNIVVSVDVAPVEEKA